MENTFYKGLFEQFKEKEFRPLRFTVYNFIENDGYVAEISGLKGQQLGMDDFVYFAFDIPEEDKNGIKNGNANVIQKYSSFSYHIEHSCQEIPECMVFIMKDLGIVIAVKTIDFDIKNLVEK